ncbi:MAG: sulfatase-like hydrolase/transferase [Acidobacteriia bacterium]|nr:sulfatase-like hydrolase/transferase [Terriglobia bacterium]
MPRTSRAFATLAKLLVAGVAIAVAGLVLAHLTRSVAWVSTSHAAQPGLSERPNIVLITLDTVRADHLSTYGYHRRTSPNLDRLARQGVVFENAIAPTSWTLASHATIFTGLLPHQHGANESAPLAPGLKTLAAILGSRGYQTAGFSANISYGYAGWGMSDGFGLYDDDGSSLRHNLAKTTAGRHLIAPAYQRLIHYDDFDRRNAAELNRDVARWFNHRSGSPYFLFVNYYDAHMSYLPPPPFAHRFGKPLKDVVREMFLSNDVSVSTDATATAGISIARFCTSPSSSSATIFLPGSGSVIW